MIRTTQPSDAEIAATLADPAFRADAAPAFSYPEVGTTANVRVENGLGELARRYTIDRRRFRLGRGGPLFERATIALLAWRHFEIPWLELHGGDGEVRVGQVVATATRAFGLWFVNPCRVVYVERDPIRPSEVAFAYGTLAGHVAQGEERFSVHLDAKSDDVVFEVAAFSRPAIWLTRLGRPWMRRIQRRFAIDAAAALARAIAARDSREIVGAVV